MSRQASRPNPFDFSNPVTDRSVLAGRATEMEQASYYLDQSREGASYSLALIGERASGKTSLLNALKDFASETGLVAAHVRLDHDLTVDELDFFREIFLSLMTSCAKRGLFGGEAGAEYDTFRRQILHDDLDTDRDQEPLAFGRVYATARAEGRQTRLSRMMLLADLEVIVERCRAEGIPAVVLLIDEGDGLAANQGLLQTLRNLLMDSSHFSLIIAGTAQMFPAINEVFSPVPRQFVRINVGPFRTWRDTQGAIRTRLALAGQEWATPGVHVCREIHSLTRGSPYEVMLLSHFAYRELTARHQRLPMSITPDVIESVAGQLAQQNPAVGETMARVQSLSRADGETLRELTELDGLSIDRFATARMDFSATYTEEGFSAAREEVMEIINRLAETGFVSVVDGQLRVDADSFQRALIKYLVLGQRSPDHEQLEPLLTDPAAEIEEKTMAALRGAIQRDLTEFDLTEFVADIHPAEFSLSVALALDDEDAVEEYSVQAICSIGLAGESVAVFVFKRDVDSEQFRERLGEVLLDEAGRLKELNVPVSQIKVESVDIEALERFRETLTQPDPVRDTMSQAVGAFYAGTSDFPGLVERACAMLLDTDPAEDPGHALELNNCAFMALGTDDSDGYLALSNRAEALEDTPVLTRMTRALWEAVQGRYDGALERLEFSEDEVLDDDELLMYSPAVLASEKPMLRYEDLIGQVDMPNILVGYRTAIEARMEDRSVADALSALEEAVPWLLGAAADAAEIEDRPEFAMELRRRAAQSVGEGDLPEGELQPGG